MILRPALIVVLMAASPSLAQQPLVPTEAKAPAPSGFMIPKAPQLRTATAAEARAADTWNLRAALNVAALQCQFSPYLRTVNNYNEMLRHHSTELNAVLNTLKGHFRRHDGARGVNSFDQYTTRTYNSFSTLDAQYSFCDAAGQVGREVLTLKRGELGAAARKHVELLRASLLPQESMAFYAINTPSRVELAQIELPMDGRRRRR
jgi:hypothetical protein